jgi:hypothetical protein
MFSSPRTEQNCPALWDERQAKDELKLVHAERVERFQPATIIENRPDIELTNAHHLRGLAADLKRTKECYAARSTGNGHWRDIAHDTEEIRSFAKMAAEAIEPVIAAVLAAADEHERKAG